MNYFRIILYIAFGIVALVLWNQWQHEHPQEAVATQQQTQQVSQSGKNALSGKQEATSSELPSSVTDHINKAVNQSKKQQQPQQQTSTTSQNKNLITVKTDVLKLKITPEGGNVTSASLLKYPLNQNNPDIPIELLNNNPKTLYIAQSGITNIPDLSDQTIPYQTKQTNYELKPGKKQLKVNLTWQNKSGLKIIKTYTLSQGSYQIRVDYHIVNNGQQQWQGRYYMQTKRRNYQGANKDHLLGFHTFFGIALSTPNHPYEKYSFSDLQDTALSLYVKGGWIAFIQHYFLSAWVPANSHQKFYYYSKALGDKTYLAGLISPEITLKNGQSKTFGSKLYIGPEIASLLNQVAPNLDLTIDYGWLWIIAVGIFWLLKHIYEVVGNWGWSIVIVTIVIKLLFYKLSETSYKSMAKMRALQPKLEALKERYSGDRQQVSKATMELYKKEKVNPLGGCLPILVQIPVFIALYWVLIESVELRQAPFILWIHDLSSPDPYYILPIIMGGTMFLQQRLSPSPSDPTQAKVMMFLPVVFTVLFLHFPAGLVLYWTVNNTLSILQQWYIMKRFKQGAYDKKNKKKLAKKKRK